MNYSKDRKKIFVSVPMAGKTEHDVWLNIGNTQLNHAKENISVSGHSPIYVNNYKLSRTIQNAASKAKHPALIYLAEAIRRMANCDDVIFGEGWENARGCQVEKLIYEKYIRDENRC